MMQDWLFLLKPSPHFLNLHGSKPDCLENVCGKLRELGFSVSLLPEWQEKLKPYIDYICNSDKDKDWFEFSILFITAPLVTIGFTHPIFLDLLIDHFKLVSDFCKNMDYNIYIHPDTFGGMYSQYKNRRLLNPETNYRLPTIWDIYSLAYMPRTHRKEEIIEAEKNIIAYILTDEYQNLPEGYGIMYHLPTKRYYAHGWNIDLPGWFGLDQNGPIHPAIFLQRLELLACFPQVHKRKWFQSGIQHLESFHTETGTYRFPSAYLKEGTSGYYVSGSYMRLEENRRRKIALELDSTFRMELLKNRMLRHVN